MITPLYRLSDLVVMVKALGKRFQMVLNPMHHSISLWKLWFYGYLVILWLLIWQLGGIRAKGGNQADRWVVTLGGNWAGNGCVTEARRGSPLSCLYMSRGKRKIPRDGRSPLLLKEPEVTAHDRSWGLSLLHLDYERERVVGHKNERKERISASESRCIIKEREDFWLVSDQIV